MAVDWSNAARHDLFRIFDFNAGYDVYRATMIDVRLRNEAERIARRPLIGRSIPGTAVRDWSLSDLQYVIRYRVAGDDITVVGVRHTREHREQR